MDVGLYHEGLDQFLNQLKTKHASLLEIGCGPGNLTRYLLSRNQNLKILGIDFAENMIPLAIKNNPQAEFRLMDSRDILSLQQQFDGIVCGFCIPYLKKEEVVKLIRDISSLLKPEGVLYLSTMEAFEDRSGIAYSDSAEESMEINYYQFEFLEALLKKQSLKILFKTRLDNPSNPEDVKDLVLLAAR
nr:class I SAM-dependent methyltransferase [Gramella oceanisediminis]